MGRQLPERCGRHRRPVRRDGPGVPILTFVTNWMEFRIGPLFFVFSGGGPFPDVLHLLDEIVVVFDEDVVHLLP